LRRLFREPELRLLALALALAITAVATVGFVTERLQRALVDEAAQLLGADLLLSGDAPWPAAIEAQAAAHGLVFARTTTFPCMVLAGEGVQLAEIKAVSAGYPLRGQLQVAPDLRTEGKPARSVPAPGEAWIDERLAGALGVRAGSDLAVGERTLRVRGIVVLEPDRSVNFIGMAPRLLMNEADLPATGLLQEGARVHYRLLVAGTATAVTAFRDEIAPTLTGGRKFEDADNARPEIRDLLRRASLFLGFSALLTVVLAAAAVALAARQYVLRQYDAWAVMRCLGASRAKLAWRYLRQFVALGLLAALAGIAAAWGLHLLLLRWLGDLLAVTLPLPGWRVPLQGLLLGQLLLLALVAPPLAQLSHVPALRVLRRELGAPSAGLLAAWGVGFALLAALVFWVAGDVRLGAFAVGGLTATLLVFVVLARLGVLLFALVGGRGWGWRRGLAAPNRQPWLAAVQTSALALGLLALLLLGVTRGELLASWQRSVPADAPNRFVINIQPGQCAQLADFFAARGVTAELQPMVRGRLASINGRPVRGADYGDDEQAQRLVNREFNLSWRAGLPPGNRISAGRWFTADESGQGVASVEEGLARRLHIGVGDRLEFNVAGNPVAVRVIGLRQLEWSSMRINFFVLTPPGVLDQQPASYVTAIRVEPARASLVDDLVHGFPNLTVIDVAALLAQMEQMVGRLVAAVQMVFVLTLVAGAVVLYVGLRAGFDERRHELALLRALGGCRGQLRQLLLGELFALGALAGLLAGGGADVLGVVIGERVLQIDMAWNLWLPPFAALLGGLLSVAVGGYSLVRLLGQAPLSVLRAEG